MNTRKNESTKALRILRKIFAAKLTVPDVKTKDRDYALALAISLLEAREADADSEEG